MGLNEFEELLKRYEEGNCSLEEQEWIENWLRQYSLQQKSAWERLSVPQKEHYLDQLKVEINQSITERSTETLRTGKIRHLGRWAMAAAASIALFLGIYLWLQQFNIHQPAEDHAIVWNIVILDPGARKKITLTDSSVIWLQGGSTLHYPVTFLGDRRVVKLEGEAFFEVHPDKSKPFVLQSGQLQAEVLGTSFNVKSYPDLDRSEIALVEGKLAVRMMDEDGAQKQQLILNAAEMAYFYTGEQTLVKSDVPMLASADDFKQGYLKFDNTLLTVALQQISKAYDIQIVSDKEKAAMHKLTAVFSTKERIRDVMEIVAKSTQAKVTWLAEKKVKLSW